MPIGLAEPAVTDAWHRELAEGGAPGPGRFDVPQRAAEPQAEIVGPL
ncbi:hypothetical protein ACFZCP_38290 [Streptomyces sp. NPDC007971]